jgi:hypothetical protein
MTVLFIEVCLLLRRSSSLAATLHAFASGFINIAPMMGFSEGRKARQV